MHDVTTDFSEMLDHLIQYETDWYMWPKNAPKIYKKHFIAHVDLLKQNETKKN